MGLGGCIILIGVGAILTFATNWHMRGVNLDVVGLILMAVGLIGVATFSGIARRRRVVVPPTPVIDEEPHHHHHHGDGYTDGYGV
jgi:sterol desaturase/sphingolipid hydroxylase (fatty acid hydroxylase superfamily)